MAPIRQSLLKLTDEQKEDLAEHFETVSILIYPQGFYG